ncbi:MAG: hypothetical protein ACWGPS_00835 [Candidatus Promineifilaceae bacterium]
MARQRQGSVRVAVVGACAAGKSTLVRALREAGYDARHVAQEHSYVPNMWQRISRPDALIYLDVAYDVVQKRRLALHLRPEDLAEQKQRLAHARQHCDLFIDTSDLSPDQVRARAFAFLEELPAVK